MSRNPYLSSHSSYTRPTRSSGFLNKSRSSANLPSTTSYTSYTSPSSTCGRNISYLPLKSSWQSSPIPLSRSTSRSAANILPNRSSYLAHHNSLESRARSSDRACLSSASIDQNQSSSLDLDCRTAETSSVRDCLIIHRI